MERISLPTRTVGRRGVVVIPVTMAVMVVVLGWMAAAVYYDVAGWYYMADFRTVVLTGRPIREIREGEIEAEWTLFEEGGRRHALAPYAVRAFDQMDRWHPEMRYLFARALWREYNGRVDALGRTPGGFVQKDLPGQVVLWLRGAIRREPTNRFYRATLAGVLKRVGGPEAQAEIDQLLLFYPPQDAYGQIRTAEMLVEAGAPKSRVLQHYCRALELVSTEVGSGLLDTLGAVPDVTGLPLLGPALTARAVSGMLANVSTYDSWASAVPDFPETHWLLAQYLSSRSMDDEANKELAKVVEAVIRRLDVQARVSTLRSVFEMACPFSRPNYTDRFLMNREIGYAAGVLRTLNRPDDAIRLYRTQISRMPTNIGARLALGEMLLARAAGLRIQARGLRDRGEADKAGELDTQAETLYDEVDAQVSEILSREPRQPAALSLRARIPLRAPTTPTP